MGEKMQFQTLAKTMQVIKKGLGKAGYQACLSQKVLRWLHHCYSDIQQYWSCFLSLPSNEMSKKHTSFQEEIGIIGMYSVDLGAVVCVFVSWVWWEGAELLNYSMVLV